MSYDTPERVDTFVQNSIMTPNNILGFFGSTNSNHREQGSGPWIFTDTETFTDTANIVFESQKAGFFEEGVVVIQIFDEKGSGTRALYTIYGQIRDALRDLTNPSKLFKLRPTGSQEGTITFNTITQRPVVEESRRISSRDWHRLDVLISYNKNYTLL